MGLQRYGLGQLLSIAVPVFAGLLVALWAGLGQGASDRQNQERARLLELAQRIAAARADVRTTERIADLAALAGVSVLMIGPDDAVLASAGAPQVTAPRSIRAVQEALRAGVGQSVDRGGRGSATVLHAAARFSAGSDAMAGFVLVSRVDHLGVAALPRMTLLLAVVGVAVAVTVVIAALQARRFARLALQVTKVFRKLATGEQADPAGITGSREFRLLGRALDDVSSRLAGQLRTIDRHRRLLESLLAKLHEGVVVVDPDRNVALINPAAVRLLRLGREADALSLTGMALERCIPHLELQRLADPAIGRADSLAGATGDDADENAARASGRRVQLETAEGTLHLLVHASDITLPIAEGCGTHAVGGRLLVMTDITALARTIQMKTDFVANASHELRTPLTTIVAAVETLQRMEFGPEADAARRFVDVIARQCRRLEALATDLLELSRLEADTARFRPRMLDVRGVLDDLRSEFAARLRARQIELRTEVAPAGELRVHVNPQLLRLVLDNLLDNAVKYSEAGTTVTVNVARERGLARFEVIDQGCGIAPEDQERVFERFYQVERARSGAERGTGLGLSIVRHAVNAMHGRVQLSSKVGAGTRVAVTIPQSD
ncbi:MAG: hypothetical protein HRF50_16725 [Phycisphaerae bacterium]|jgi:two-component system phosphate regulon sensor histidine kinase PhoR